MIFEIWDMRSAEKGAVGKPPAILFWSIGSAGGASKVVDFYDNFGWFRIGCLRAMTKNLK
jgi:hypothetical protein